MVPSSSEPTKNRQSLLTRNAVTYVQIEKASKIFKPLLFSTEIERYAIQQNVSRTQVDSATSEQGPCSLRLQSPAPHPRVLRARIPRFFFRARK